MADEGVQPLTGAEVQEIEAQKMVERAEAQTGTEPVARMATTQDPTIVDSRFDKDDLRQGKPPPAMRGVRLPRKIKVTRPRHLKGTPFNKKSEKTIGNAIGGAKTDEEADEADMTEDEVEIEEEEEVQPVEEEGKKGGGIFSKVLGRDKD